MAVMIASFDNTMRGWIVRSMKADIYVSSAGAQSASSTSMISAATVEEIRAMPGVAELAVLKHMGVNLPDGPVHAMGGDMEFTQRRDLHAWVQAPARDWWLANEPAALINESLGERLQKHRGDLIEVPTPAGLKSVRVAGVYADYGNERGTILLHEDRFREWFHNEMAWRVAIMLKPGADAETMRAALQHGHQGLSVFTQAHLRAEALRIFRQTFAVTYALEAVGVIVAVAGLGLALASLMLDRRKELATLRAIGFTTREASQACAWEGFGLAVSGVAAGIIAGVWLGWLLIERVNKQSFGWTLSFHFPGWQIAAMAVAVIGTGIVVSAFVGRWSSTLTVDREE
jgi:putative ABC transport system permease protein